MAATAPAALATVTAAEDRAAIRAYLDRRIQDAAGALAAARRRLAADLAAGRRLGGGDMEHIAAAQAAADLWGEVTSTLARWDADPRQAPPIADLVEAAHHVRSAVLRGSIAYQGPHSPLAFDAAAAQAAQAARRAFAQHTATIYPQGSPLADLA